MKISFSILITGLFCLPVFAEESHENEKINQPNGWWKITSETGESLFKLTATYINSFDYEQNRWSEAPTSKEMELFFYEDKGIFSTIDIPFNSVKKIIRNKYSSCIDYKVVTEKDEQDGSICSPRNRPTWFVVKGSTKRIPSVTRMEGIVINYATGKKSFVRDVTFRFDRAWTNGGGLPTKIEILNDEQSYQPILARLEEVAKLQEKRQADEFAKNQAEQQKEKEKHEQTVKNISSLPKGSEDSCQNTSYELNDTLESSTTTIKCQIAGDGLTIGDLKTTGWIITNVSKVGEVKTLLKLSTQYLFTIKKIR